MLKKIAVAVALSCAATSVQAATFVFSGGTFGAQSGQTIVADFNGADDALVNGTGFLFLTGTSTNGAQPDPGDGTRYLSVLARGNALISLGNVSSFGLDVGSLDSYNSLFVQFADGGEQQITGDMIFNGDANGNRHSAGANGRIVVTAGVGEVITGLRLTSGSNSFEVDNLAVTAVPEPASWGLMLAGFGLLGAGLRNRRKRGAPLAA